MKSNIDANRSNTEGLWDMFLNKKAGTRQFLGNHLLIVHRKIYWKIVVGNCATYI